MACVADLTDGGTLRFMLESTLSGIVAETSNVDPLLQDYVPAFVDAVIVAASQCNQSPQMADVAHTLIESEPTPVQCALLIKSLQDFQYEAQCNCQGRTPVQILPQRSHQLRTGMGKVWARLMNAFGAGGLEEQRWSEEESRLRSGGGIRG